MHFISSLWLVHKILTHTHLTQNFGSVVVEKQYLIIL